MSQSSPKPKFSEKIEYVVNRSMFNTSDSDVTIRSGDGVLLYLHRTNLEAISRALDAPEFLAPSDDNVVALPESSEILGTVFLFIYPNRHPNLRDQDFETLLEISDAVQKYEIFAAMSTCETRLMEAIPMHATDVLLHALRHNLPEIINESALALCRLPVIQTAELLQSMDVLPWLRYQEAWKTIFQLKDGVHLNVAESCQEGDKIKDPLLDHRDHPLTVCKTCYSSLIVWAMELEAKNNLKDLRKALTGCKFVIFSGDSPCCQHCFELCNMTNRSCRHLEAIARHIEAAIDNVPPFVDYLPSNTY